MLRMFARTCLAATALLAVASHSSQNQPEGASSAAEPPIAWIDPDTGHRVVRLTREAGSASLYFHQNPFTSDGGRMIYTTPDGISVLDLKGNVRVIVAGRRSRNVYYQMSGAVYSTDVDTGTSRMIARLPSRGSISTANADESLLAGTYVEGTGQDYYRAGPQQPQLLDQPANKGRMMEERLAARLPMGIFVVDTGTGALKTILKGTDWFNHLQFSPTDPTLLMFCHEGPWHKVDRIWTIRADGGGLTKIHHRTMAMEIFGHEFWSADGRTIWYDLQTPRGEDFWLAGYHIETGARTWYHLRRNEWSVHFNISPDGKLFAGDGGDEGQVARAMDGKWIYLFRPEPIPNRGSEDREFINPGVLRSERLVNMSKHQYRLEPNVIFTPDQKWIVFRSNMFGPSYIFAVEVAKAD
jgi:oligogalacturonide lyase